MFRFPRPALISDRVVAVDGQVSNFIIPIDVTDDEGSLQFFATSVSLNRVVTDLRKSAPKSDLIIIFDACREELQYDFKTKSTPEATKSFTTMPVPYEGDTLLAFATEPNRLASDEGAEAGPFATALAAELRKSHTHHEQIFFNVKAAVWKATKHGQRPWYMDQYVKRLYFAQPGEEGSPPEDVASIQWRNSVSSNNVDGYKSFVKKFPNSTYALEASSRLLALEEEEDWKKVSESGNADDLDGFLKQHPYGLRAAAAKERFTNLMRAKEDHDWQAAKDSGSFEALVNFVRRYPNSPRYSDAMEALFQARDAAAKVSFGQAIEASAWDEAARKNTIEAYEHYLKEHFGATHEREARQRVAVLTEQGEWENTAASNSLETLENYLLKFPHGVHASEASNRLEQLRAMESEAWKVAEQTDTVAAYQYYLDSVKGGSHAAEARVRVAAIRQSRQGVRAESEGERNAKTQNLFFPQTSFMRFESGKMGDILNLKDAQPIRRLILSNDLSRLYSGGDDGALRIWDLNAVDKTIGLEPRHKDRIYALARSSNSRYLATASFDRSVFLWDTHSNERAGVISVKPKVYSMTFSPTGRWIAAAGRDGQVDFIGTSKKEIVKHRHVSPSARIHAIAYLPNKTEDLVLGDGKGTLRLWTVRQGKERTVTEAHSQEILALTVDQSGTKIASGGIDKRIKFWDDNLNRVFEIPEAHAKYITALRFLPDGQHIASGGGDHKVRIWDVRTGQNVSGPFSGHKGDIEGIEFSPDGKYMFTASEDKTIKIWEVEAGKLLYTLVAFVDGSYIVYDNDRYFASKQQFSASRAIEEMLRKPAPR